MSRKPPEKLVVMGRISAPFGVKGWIKIRPYTAQTGALASYRTWWVGEGEAWQEQRIAGAQVQSQAVVAKLEGCDDRETASAFRGKHIAVPRTALPEPGKNEFYWADLIGLKVVNHARKDFGRVRRILSTGANDVLVVQGERERLIPFTEEVIRDVDLARGVIGVSWDADY